MERRHKWLKANLAGFLQAFAFYFKIVA